MSAPVFSILVVDDIPTNVELLGAALEDEYEVRFATSGLEALELLQTLTPDLIVLDVMMPGMDGYETFRHLHELPHLKRVPVMFLTAMTDVESELRGLHLGAVDYITKPFNIELTKLRVRNILQRYYVERELDIQRERLQVTLASIGDAVITTDASGRIEYLNPVAERLTGWMRREAVGRLIEQVFDIVHEKSREIAPCPIRACLAENRVVSLAHETLLRSRNGGEHGIEDSAAPIHDKEGHAIGCVMVFHDATEQRRLSNQITYQATHDALTGLVNRAEFDVRLRHAHAEARDQEIEHCLLYIDLDQFKLVNDSCGHSAGDRLLKDVTAIMADCVRGMDTVARLGGDEFAIILNCCGSEPATRIAQKICDNVESMRFTHDGQRFQIGASIGLVSINKSWHNTVDLLQAADSACYAAKEAGRSRVHAYIDVSTQADLHKGEANWAARITEALDLNKFVLYAQRIAPLNSSEQGLYCEILIRLKGDDGVLYPPGAFIPAAERFHLAGRLDRWVINAVFEILARQPSLEGVARIAINLSGQSIGDREFHSRVQEMCAETSVDLSRLCFEITETSAISRVEDARTFMAAMQAHGIRFSLDDFGSGLSSFGYLKMLPVDYLKIDGQFVRNVTDNPIDLFTVKCIADLATALGKETVAEFVETIEIANVLRELGVNFAQGYLVHKPEPLIDLLAASRLK